MDINFTAYERETIFQVVRSQCRVIYALMLRDIKTRFLGNAWGYLISLAWPLGHIGIVLAINVFSGRVQPYGDSIVLWAATGTIPFIAFSYMARFMMLGIAVNRPLLIFPQVKLIDILISRALVEILSAAAVILILAVIFYSFNIPFIPIKPLVAFYAVAASLLLGLGAGVINAIIATIMPFWAIVFFLSLTLLWAVSGVVFVPDSLPHSYLVIFSLNPVAHCIAWFRSAYYDNYGSMYLDKFYLIAFSVVCLAAGLLFERLLRGRILQG